MSARKTSLILWALLSLFLFRVLGQVVVALWAPSFLPPMEAWYSGLMPYRFLLPSQIVILLLFSKIAFDLCRGHGYWFGPKKQIGMGLLIFGTIYFLAMIARFFLQGISIPVIFHWILAGYILILGLYYRANSLQIKNNPSQLGGGII